MLINTKGLIIRETKYKEADAILTILTSDGRKLCAKAVGKYRKTSRVSAACQLLTYSDLTISTGRNNLTIRDAETIHMFLGLRDSPKRLALGCYISEILDILGDSDSDNPELLQLGLNMLYAISELSLSIEIVRAAFSMRATVIAGYSPNLSQCLLCENTNIKDAFFNLQAGGIICNKCKNYGLIVHEPLSEAIDTFVSSNILNAIRHFCTAPIKRILQFKINESDVTSLANICEDYLTTKLNCGFKSLKYYKSLSQSFP